MTIEIRAGAKRSEQKGTAEIKELKERRNHLEKWTDKRKPGFTEKAWGARVCVCMCVL